MGRLRIEEEIEDPLDMSHLAADIHGRAVVADGRALPDPDAIIDPGRRGTKVGLTWP
jgi:hypothetical protein